MGELIASLDQVTPDWLTCVLEEKNCLGSGRVTKVDIKPESSLAPSICHLKLSYSEDVPSRAPSHLYLKLAKSGASRNEIEFYTLIAPAMPDPPSVRCYDAVYSPEIDRAHLLLEDVSGTHFRSRWLPPLKQECERFVDCLANFHAFWWDHPRLGNDIGMLPDEDQLGIGFDRIRHSRLLEKKYSAFADFMGERLAPERREIYQKALSSFPNLRDRRGRKRLTNGHHLTIIHGDTVSGNVFFPHDPTRDRVRIIDWEFWDIRVGTDDLAYTYALWWFPERRAAMERDLIKRYHDGLLKHGVENYDWEDCWHDYRLSVIRTLFFPILFWSIHIPARTWWQAMELSLFAFQDLGCVEVL